MNLNRLQNDHSCKISVIKQSSIIPSPIQPRIDLHDFLEVQLGGFPRLNRSVSWTYLNNFLNLPNTFICEGVHVAHHGETIRKVRIPIGQGNKK
jgi:hypothetical protein